MVGTKTLKVQYTGDASSLNRTISDIERAHSTLGSKVRTIGRGIVSAAKVAAVGLAAVGAAAAYAFGQFEESEKIAAQTDAVLKSTGNSAKVTAGHIASLANAISLKTGIDDEAIQTGENLLLTFTRIRNEVGKGNHVFDQTTKVITDMSVSLDQDMKSSAIQVGKALNDPIKGLTSLTRVGVAFTWSQKKAIETMVEGGDLLGAQKVILAELTKEFGGSAAAQATDSAKMKVAFSNLAETVGGLLAPAITVVVQKLGTFATFVATNLPAGIAMAKQAFSDLWALIGPVVTPVFEAIQSAVSVLSDGFKAIAPTVAKFGAILAEDLMNVLQAIGDVIGKHLWPALQKLWTALQPLIKIVAVVAGVLIHLALTALPPLLKGLGFVIDVIAIVITWIGKFITFVAKIATGLKDAAVTVFNWFKELPSKVKGFLVGAVNWLVEAGKNIVRGFWNGIEALAEWIWGKVTGFFGNIVDKVKDFLHIGSPSKLFFQIGKNVVEGLALGIDATAPEAQKALQRLVDHFGNFMDQLKGKFQEFKGTIRGSLSGFKDLFGSISGLFGQTDEDGNPITVTADAIAAAVQAQVAQARELAKTLRQLAKAGLSQGLLSQLAGQGAAGIAQGQALLGNPELIAQMNAAQAAITQVAQATSENLGEKFFGQALRRAKDRLDEMSEALRLLNKEMRGPGAIVVNVAGSVLTEGELVELIRRAVNRNSARNAFASGF